MPEYTADLQSLLDVATWHAHEVERAKSAYEQAAGNAAKTRMHFLQAKVASWGFTPNTVFYLTEWQWKMVGKDWEHTDPHETLCIFRRVQDCGGLMTATCIIDPDALPTMMYSERLKSGRWSLREHCWFAQNATELLKGIRFA